METPDDDSDLVIPFRNKLDGYTPIPFPIREKRKSWENPNVCEHGKGMWVDRALKTVECMTCGASIDPCEALFITAARYHDIEWKIQAIKAYREKERKQAEREKERKEKRAGGAPS